MLSKLAVRLWQDDCGAVIATEYLALGTIVALGSVAGLTTVRDATNAEMAEYGNSVREMRQNYQAQSFSGGGASKQGSSASDSRGARQGVPFNADYYANP